MTTNKKSTVNSIGDHIYPLDKTLSVALFTKIRNYSPNFFT